MKKERPILFSTPMVQALLAGRKTQTRRIIKPQPTDDWMHNTKQFSKSGSMFDHKGKQVYWISDPTEKGGEIKCPYGVPGDILWVRETFALLKYGSCEPFFGYKADGIGPAERKYKPSIHIPKAGARIWLEITDIRVERVQDIGEQDAFEEGAYDGKGPHGVGYLLFEELWVNINGVESWEANPFVWCLTFKVLSTTGRPDKL